MRNQWQKFLLALGFFTRIPVPSLPDFQESDLNHAAKYFPLIGVIVGLVGALSFVISGAYLPQNIAVLISMASTIYLTGAFHEDGLADSADGIGGGWERERILTIMQDSRLGTYGAVALFLMLFAKFQVLSTLPALFVPFALVVGHALSRLAAVWIMISLTYSKPEGKAKPLATRMGKIDIWIAHLFGLLPFIASLLLLIHNQETAKIILSFVLMTLIPVVLSAFWWRQKIKYWIGGYTGDTLGAVQQITELAFCLGFLLWSIHR